MSDSDNKLLQSGGDRRNFLRTSSCVLLALAGLPIAEVIGSGTGAEKRYTLPAADSVNIDRQAQVILVRFQNSIYAFALACPHEHAAGFPKIIGFNARSMTRSISRTEPTQPDARHAISTGSPYAKTVTPLWWISSVGMSPIKTDPVGRPLSLPSNFQKLR